MADRSITIRVGANVTGFISGLKQSEQATRNLANMQMQAAREMAAAEKAAKQRRSEAISTLSTAAGAAGLALTGMAVLAVKKFADFDQAMSNVAATGADARDSIDALRQASIQAGADTAFSATEAAGAVEELAKAGVSASDILKGGLKGSLNLAAAGSLDVADAAGITSIALTQFGLKGKDASHVADLLAAGAGKAMGDVSDMGMALKQSGLVAAQTGLTIEETTGALAAFANAGLLGSDAGTSLKTMLQRLTPQSVEAQKQFDALGISAYDAQGNFVGLSAFAGQLQSKMKDLTPEARNAALSVMFGSDAVRGASVLYSQGAAGIQDWITKVDDSGYAATTAATKMDNLKGDIEKLSGSFETALIGIGESANGPLRSLVQSLDDAVDGFNGLPEPVKTATLLIAGAGGLALLGVAGLGKLAIATTRGLDAMKDLGIITEATAGKMTGFAGKAGAAAVKIGVIVGAIELLNSSTNRGSLGVEEMTSKLNHLADSTDPVKDLFGDMFSDKDLARGKELKTFLDQMTDTSGLQDFGRHADDLGTSITRIFGDKTVKWSEMQGRLDDIGAQFADLATSSLPDASKAFKRLYTEAGGTDAVGKSLLKAMPALRDSLIGVADGAGMATDDATLLKIILGDIVPPADTAATAAEKVATATQEAADALSKWQQAVADADGAFVDLGDAYQGVIDKNTAVATSTADATKKSTDSWEDYYDGVSVSAEDYIGQLQAQVDAQTNWESNMIDLAGRVRDGMTGAMAEAAFQMLDELMSLGPEGAQQVALLKTMSAEQFTKVVTLWSEKGTEAVSAFTSKYAAIKHPVITPVVDTAGALSQMGSLIRRLQTDEFGVALGVGSYVKRAGGGPIVGAGTSTSDSVLVAASNGEHMLPAAEVGMLGGQSAVYALRAQIRSGALRLAGGGAVQQPYMSRQYVAPAQYTQASGSTAAAAAVPMVGSLTINEVTDPVGTAHAVVRYVTSRGNA